jgi:hypothetical protein
VTVDVLPLPSGDHEGLEGFSVTASTGEEIGVVAAVERADGELELVVASGRTQTTYRTMPFRGVSRIDVDEQTVTLSDDAAKVLVAAGPRTVRRTSVETEGMVRYLPSTASVAGYQRPGAAASSSRAFLTIILAILGTPAILAAGALAAAGSSKAAWIFLAVAAAILAGAIFAWPAARWMKTHH